MIFPTDIAADQSPEIWESWALSRLHPNNWRSPIVMSSSYQTSVKGGVDAAEQRYGLRSKPYRSLTYTLSGFSKRAIFGLTADIRKRAKSRNLVPIYQDIVLLPSAVSSGQTSIAADVSKRRFYAGGKAVLFSMSREAITDWEIVDITTSSPLVVSATSQAYASGAFLVPLMLATPTFETGGVIHTPRKVELSVESIEQVGISQLPASASANTTPSGFSEFEGLPIFDVPRQENPGGIPVAWSQKGNVEASGIASFFDTYGTRPSFADEFSFLGYREEFWNLLNFWDSRRGSAYSFWHELYMDSLDTELISSSSFDILENGDISDWDSINSFFIRYKDGSVQVTNKTTIAALLGVLTVSFSPILIQSVSEIESIRVAEVSRFAGDELEETWYNDGVVTTTLPIVSVEEEKSVVISDLEILTTTGLSAGFVAGECNAAPGDAGGACPFASTAEMSDYSLDFNEAITALFSGSAPGSPLAMFRSLAEVTAHRGTSYDATTKVFSSSLSPDSACNWDVTNPVDSAGTFMQLDSGLLYLRGGTTICRLELVPGERWVLFIRLLYDPGTGNDLTGIRCEYEKTTGDSPVGIYVPVTSNRDGRRDGYSNGSFLITEVAS